MMDQNNNIQKYFCKIFYLLFILYCQHITAYSLIIAAEVGNEGCRDRGKEVKGDA